MEHLAAFVLIGGFFVVALGSIALCGIAGAALAGVIPTVRAHGPALHREWLQWAVVASMGSTFVAVLLWGLLDAAAISLISNRSLPIMCWTGGAMGGAASRIVVARAGGGAA